MELCSSSQDESDAIYSGIRSIGKKMKIEKLVIPIYDT
jgi:hypothetical protein